MDSLGKDPEKGVGQRNKVGYEGLIRDPGLCTTSSFKYLSPAGNFRNVIYDGVSEPNGN